MKTAMQELKEKLQVVIDELNDNMPIVDTQEYGYRLAMENVIKDIDAQMLEQEKQQIIDAWQEGYYAESDNEPNDSYGYFDKTFED